MLAIVLTYLSAQPPTIITTRSSPLCTAVRDVIAPALGGMIFQDRIIAQGEALMRDMKTAGDAFTLDNVHLGTDVYHLAANNIAIHHDIDHLREMKLDDPKTDAELGELRVRLQAIADSQAASLNIMSGIAQSNDLADIASVGNEAATAISGDRGIGAPNEGASLASIASPVQPGRVGGLIAQDDRNTQAAEKALLPALLPVVNRCR